MYPAEFRYSKEHEWVKVDADIGTVGITDHAQDELGDVVFIELPDVKRKLERNEVMGAVESVKAVSDIYSPLSGEVTEINSAVVDDPEMINDDPHGEAWLLKMRITNPDELKDLMSAKDYESFIAKE